ncbi:MAG: 2Fe-2S iron-sulfur cluster-binding protein [bacterium]
MVNIIIDGKEVQVEKGTMVLEAAKGAGIDIPTLCYHEALSPYGACRLCVVEVTRGNRTRMTTSCNYPALRDGEVISTNSEKVVKTRRMIMELILARCPNSQVIRDMARKLGVAETRFKAEGEGDNCILCGLCVRACQEAIGVSAISFVNRGTARMVSTPFHIQSEVCTGCGACAAVCPTGVIKIEDSPDGVRTLQYWHTKVPLKRCEVCGDFFSPAPQLEGLMRKVPSVEDAMKICPPCRRKTFGDKMARWGYRDFRREGVGVSTPSFEFKKYGTTNRYE